MPATVRGGLDHPFSPGFVMLAVEFQPALFSRRGGNAIFVPGAVMAGLIDRRLTVEGFEFKRFLDRQTNENAPTVFVDEIAPWQVARRISHVARFRLRSRGPLAHPGVGGRPT